jgi:anti-sigma factor RsiW
MKITRDVVTDLWPLYLSGEASPDTRALVDAFLTDDPEFAQRLRENGSRSLLSGPLPALPLDHEARTFASVRRKLRGFPWLLWFAMIFSCFAFGRIVSDTSWDVSPRNFIITATIAGIFWIAYFVSLWRLRRRWLRRRVTS